MDREDDSGLNQERTQRTFLEKRKSSIRYVCLVYIGSTLNSILQIIGACKVYSYNETAKHRQPYQRVIDVKGCMLVLK